VPQSTMPQVKTIVHLMLENRSLDNVLGWLYEKRAPSRVFPDKSPSAYDGLIAGKFSQPLDGQSYPIVPIPDEYAKYAIPIHDPYEEMYGAVFWNGVMNQVFGDQNIITGMPSSGTTPTMKGFYQDYHSVAEGEWHGKDILWTYKGTLPIMNLLAGAYSVSDAWFSSVPTQTNPNRAYSLIGTSQGRENNLSYSAVETYVADTIFNAIGKAGRTWGLYYTDLWHAPKDKPKQCFTQYTFPNLTNAPNGEIGTHTDFFQRVQDGTLPNFTYLEPKWGYGIEGYYTQGTDYHPPTLVSPGEAFLFQVFLSLAKCKQWDEMLFIVTFDEHGGTYDHVKPSWGAKNPDGIKGSYGFNFDLFGVRVPTILISPFAYPASVFRAKAESAYPFDHTSCLKTLLGWAGVDLAQWNFGLRVQNAPTFEYVLADHHVNWGGFPGTENALAAEAPPEPEHDPNDVSALFVGIPFASVRAILHDNKTLEDIQSAIAEYHRDPEKFEATLG